MELHTVQFILMGRTRDLEQIWPGSMRSRRSWLQHNSNFTHVIVGSLIHLELCRCRATMHVTRIDKRHKAPGVTSAKMSENNGRSDDVVVGGLGDGAICVGMPSKLALRRAVNYH
jgi:hypothetical protein